MIVKKRQKYCGGANTGNEIREGRSDWESTPLKSKMGNKEKEGKERDGSAWEKGGGKK